VSKKAVLGALAAAIALAYGGSTWWAGTKIKSVFDTALDELPKQTALVRVVDRSYEKGFFGAVSTVTIEIGCAAQTAAQVPAIKPAEGDDEEGDGESAAPFKPVRLTFRDTIRHGPLAGGTLAAATIDSELVLDVKSQAKAEQLFGKAKPLTAYTKVGFDGGYTSDLTVAGEDREDVSAEFHVTARGFDQSEAKAAANGTKLKVEEVGDALVVSLDNTGTRSLPRNTNVGQMVILLKVPRRLAVRIEPHNGRLVVSKIVAAEIMGSRGETRVVGVLNRLVLTHSGGPLEIDDVAAGHAEFTTMIRPSFLKVVTDWPKMPTAS